jgi:8-oxo-dGTP pyrophosphatase MutT (NUDIX family)
MTRDVHVVAAAIVEREGRFLIVEERINGALKLNQPAGHWEDGETLFEAVKRETLEESGWDVEPVAFLGTYEFHPPDLDYSFLRFAFICETRHHDSTRKLDDGIERALWLTREELAQRRADHRSPALLACVDDYLAGRRFPLKLVQHLKA